MIFLCKAALVLVATVVFWPLGAVMLIAWVWYDAHRKRAARLDLARARALYIAAKTAGERQALTAEFRANFMATSNGVPPEAAANEVPAFMNAFRSDPVLAEAFGVALRGQEPGATGGDERVPEDVAREVRRKLGAHVEALRYEIEDWGNQDWALQKLDALERELKQL